MKIFAVLGVVLLVACAESDRAPIVDSNGNPMACTDQDGDGYGEACAQGGDCNDADPSIHEGCVGCVRPADGCACDNGSKPVSCYLEPSADETGALMCHEGTRYCRSGRWSACESIFSYPKPKSELQAIVDPTADHGACSDCEPNCFQVKDNLDNVDGGVGTGNNTTFGDGGGLQIDTWQPEGGTGGVGGGSGSDAGACMPGFAPDTDCDGIEDDYDPYPNDPPFETTNPAIFLDLAPGETGSGAIDLEFKVNSADIYFLVDQTTTMGDERDNLVKFLTTGDFVGDVNFKCADYDYDHKPNNELKELGLIGALRCYIRDANFGVGFFREIPLSTYYEFSNDIAFRNLSDITTDVSKVRAAVELLEPLRNRTFDEAAIPALHSLVTGGGMYFGQNRISVPKRVDCPADTWGYPCFRKDAIPIVVLFTDARSHNGPSPNNPYPSSISISTANTAKESKLIHGGETIDSAVDLGDLTSSVVTVAGDTTGFASNYTAGSGNEFSCAASGTPDVFYKFILTSAKSVNISTQMSEFDNALAFWARRPLAPTALPAITNNNNDTATGTPYVFSDPYEKAVSVEGNSTGLTANYLASDLGCNAYAGSADAAFTFTLANSSKVSLDTIGSPVATSLSLYRGTPAVAATPTAITNNNDTFASAKAIGPLGTTMHAFSGTTDNASINPTYTNQQMGGLSTSCSVADDAPDAVYSFSVSDSPTTKVRITAEDSTLDTVLALTTNEVGATTMPDVVSHSPTNQTNLTPSALDDRVVRAVASFGTGSGNPVTTLACNANTSSYDSIYRFTLTNERTVTLDTSGTSAFDTVIGLYKGNTTTNAITSIPGSVTYTDNTTAGNLTPTPPANGRRIVVSNGSTAIDSKYYTAAQVGSTCGAVDGSPDSVYKFQLNSKARVKIDTFGSGFDTVMSLHAGLPDQFRIAYAEGDLPLGTAEPVSNRYVRFDNTTLETAAADVLLSSGTCTAPDSARDHIVPFTVSVPGNYEIDTIQSASGLDTVLGLFGSSVTSWANNGNLGEAKTSSKGVTGANDVGTIDDAWRVYTGTTKGMSDNGNVGGCNADTNSNDVFYRFTVGGGLRTVEIKTQGSAFNTTTALRTWADAVPAGAGVSVPAGGCHDGSLDDGDTITATLSAGDYYVVLRGRSSTTPSQGNYRISFRDITNGATATPLIECDDDDGGGTKSSITRYLTAGTYHAVIKSKTTGGYGSYGLSIKHVEWLNQVNAGNHRLECNDNGPLLGTASMIDRELDPGVYYVVVKGKSNTTGGYGSFQLNVTDMSATPDGLLSCNDNIATGTTSSITEKLRPGTYFAVISSKTATPSGAYTMTMRDASVSTVMNTLLACDHATGPQGSSFIEADLAPGTYNVIVKGKGAAAKGAYKLQVRNANNMGRLACDQASGTGSRSSFESALLDPGTYTAILTGTDATSAAGGSYKLTIRDSSRTAPLNSANTNCSNPGSGDPSLSTGTLSAGTYYVGIKGGSASADGNYQLHIGAGTTSSSTYSPPTYATTRDLLTAKNVHVIPIVSCYDDYTSTYADDVRKDCPNVKTQYTTIAKDTKAVNSADEPLYFQSHADGTGLTNTVVDGIKELAKYLTMDVTVRINETPDKNPGFIFERAAIPEDNNGCGSVVDGTKFLACKPGARPRFQISITNPKDSPVPLNDKMKDPNGGYNFRAELIGNDRVVDSVPIYVIPEEVRNPPPPPQVYPMGTYWQTLSGNQCTGQTVLPDWDELSWNASVPNGTSVSFGVCAGDSAATVNSCATPSPICTVTGGGNCTTDTDCTNGGFCSTYGNCNRVTGGSCTTNAQCSGGATCRTNVCVYSSPKVDVGAALGGRNYASFLRVQIGLTANTADNIGPTVSEWGIKYLCKSAL